MEIPDNIEEQLSSRTASMVRIWEESDPIERYCMDSRASYGDLLADYEQLRRLSTDEIEDKPLHDLFCNDVLRPIYLAHHAKLSEYLDNQLSP